jgi:NAD(P)-dependent dehydrogenase (short-subunit alcohol dehydrogenase family)
MALRGIAEKVAVVTGGASGIGEGAARRLAEEGAKVVVVDWNADSAEAVAASLPGEAIAVVADVSQEADVDRYQLTAVDRFGRIDLFHLNAGISGPFDAFPDVTAEDFDRVIAVNLRSVFLGIRGALRQLRSQASPGAIVTTSSIAGLQGGEALIPYTAAKHGVIGLTKNAAMYGAPYGIRVNCIAPGMIVTPLMEPMRASMADPDAGLAAIKSVVPMERFGSADEVGALVAYLLSDDASYLTGIVVPVDGGAMAASSLRIPSRTAET